MPEIRLRVNQETINDLMEMAQAEENHSARLMGRKAKRITRNGAALGCFVEGLEDLHVRVSEYASDEETEDDD